MLILLKDQVPGSDNRENIVLLNKSSHSGLIEIQPEQSEPEGECDRKKSKGNIIKCQIMWTLGFTVSLTVCSHISVIIDYWVRETFNNGMLYFEAGVKGHQVIKLK